MKGILLKQTPKEYISPITAPYVENINKDGNKWQQKEGSNNYYYEIPNIGGHNKGSNLFVHFYVLEEGVGYKMTHGLPVAIGHTIIIKTDGTVRIEASEKISGRLVILGFTTDVLGGNA